MEQPITKRCKHGHELTGANVRIRSDRNGAIECRACLLIGVSAFRARKPLYDVWHTMIRRCYDPKFTDWHLYGGKTPPITVCDLWRQSYDAFETDMWPRPTSRHTLDRIDGNQGYFPENCRWATPHEQARNRSNNRLLTHDGRTLTLAEWAERTGIRYMALFYRLERGWSVERALTTPVDASPQNRARNRPTNHRITHNGENLTIAEWAERCGQTTHQLAQRLRQGWSLERTISTPMRRYGQP